MFALIDCNNFYASCERLFRPDLHQKPIIVLSSNDGCVIARSNEAKSLGIAMGVPFFQIQMLCKKHKVAVFSSNFTLYGDLSQRVMSTIEESWPHIEIYSIDEAFLDLSTMPENQRTDFCVALQKKILKHTGIPTSIGIGATKTLAKTANFLCKKVLKTPVFHLSRSMDYWLTQISVGDLWGVGRRWSIKLNDIGIHTAKDLAMIDPHYLRKKFNVVLMRTALELRGVCCGGIEEPVLNQSILSSRSFAKMQTELERIAGAVSAHCARAVEKLRSQKLTTKKIYVSIHTNRFRDDLAQQHQTIEIGLVNPTDDLRIITKHAKQGLERLFKKGNFYKKAGVCLMDLIPKNLIQQDLFCPVDEKTRDKTECFMSIMDNINQRFGSQTIYLAAQGHETPWAKRELKSPSWTTSWSELPCARV